MANSSFNQSQTGNASELGAGSVKLATQQQVDDKQADDGGVPLVVTPDKISAADQRTVNVLQAMDGSTTPKAVGIINNTAFLANASLHALQGFITEDKSSLDLIPDFLNVETNNFNTGTQTYSNMDANAGTDRVMVIYYWSYNTQTPPTGVTWNSIAGTLLESVDFSTGGNITTFVIPIGTSGSLETFDLIFTGGSTGTGNVRIMHALVYDKSSQTPGDHSSFSVGGGGQNKTLSDISSPDGFGRISAFTAYSNAQFINEPSSWTLRATNGGGTDSGDFEGSIGEQVQANQASGSNDTAITAVALASASTPDTVTVQLTGTVAGFTGLTEGAEYFAGADGVVALSGGILVGVAVSDTQLLISRSPRCIGGVSAGPTSASTITYTHGLGVVPKIIRLAAISGANGSFPGCHSIGSFDGVNNQCVYVQGKSTSRNADRSTTFSIRFGYNSSGSESQVATGIVQNITDTTFDIVWSGSNASAQDFHWEAQG